MLDAPVTPELPVIKRSRWFWFRALVSVFFGLLTVALCVLWVRSYLNVDYLSYASEWYFKLSSDEGRFVFWRGRIGSSSPTNSWRIGTLGSPGIGGIPHALNQRGVSDTRRIIVPILAPAFATATAAAISWMPCARSFSLRTLLIATTLVAVVLGLAVWA